VRERDELLRIRDLTVTFPGQDGRVVILDNVALDVYGKEIVGLVGESGSGKTMTSLTVMGFLPPSGRIEGGEIWFQESDLLRGAEEQMRQIRGREIAMIFQSTRSALNPLMRVGEQVARVYRLQRGLGASESRTEAVRALNRMVAMMVACEPALLIADEPTTGLDVTIQAQIFELIRKVQESSGASILLITHDLGVVAETCDRVIVMYAGQVMETAGVESLFGNPVHPYTQRLLRSVLRVDRQVEMPEVDAGFSEEVTYAIRGCRFAARCPRVIPECWEHHPVPDEIHLDHWVSCHNPG